MESEKFSEGTEIGEVDKALGEEAVEVLARYFEHRKENLYEFLASEMEQDLRLLFTGDVKIKHQEAIADLTYEEIGSKTHLTGTAYFELELSWTVGKCGLLSLVIVFGTGNIFSS